MKSLGMVFRGLWANFKLPLALTFAGLALAAWMNGVDGFLVVSILAPLEISLSFDNAVLNAKVLKGWNSTWRDLFIGVGLPIAVFGMRLVFPVAIVAIMGHLNLLDAALLALHNPQRYAQVISSAEHEVNAFGGAFLFLVFLSWAFDGEKDTHWFAPLEHPMAKLSGKASKLDVLVTVASVLGASVFLADGERLSFITAGVAGVMSFIAAHALGDLLQSGDAGDAAASMVKQGIGGLLYLELLDASCSFDGVIGALAISNKILLVTIGLGIGAAYVRAMTLLLVKHDSLGEFKYLEHGAMYAVGFLALVMFASVKVHAPDIVTGGVGVVLIIIALLTSVRANKEDDVEQQQKGAVSPVTL